ncbi:TsoY family (seleno)protein [Paracoccus marinaquae]|uniref:Uncharacterized protein n=1 Tax=Paracoccus marinaquae TaxID=2841926 RepID=A0ABS6API1_9RHOB|nr:hypothetical protein [Paracoccus marinaquae]MBU3031539.1 hypothetical protein [Paracoccus marinaquae]
MPDPRNSAWSPLYYLASVGAGGLTVTFFMWLYFWVPHPGSPVPLFNHVVAAFAAGQPLSRAMIALAAAGIAVFAWMNLSLLVWNLRAHRAFHGSEAEAQLKRSNGQTQLMALPLAIAMSINVGFILGMIFVPGLWSVVEYLFPAALLAFLLTGALALRQLGAFLGRVLTEGGFDFGANGSFAQMLPAFALAMVGVGLSASAAMSTTVATAGVAVVLSSFFFMASAIVAAVSMILGVWSMFRHGAAREALPTVMVVIPLLTVLGILLLRQNHGLHAHFGGHSDPAAILILLTRIFSVQILFGLLGVALLRRSGYAAEFLHGERRSAGAYALVCPGVALMVMGMFWVNKGLVGAGIIASHGAAYWTLSAALIAVQAASIALVLYLNRRHFRTSALAQPA